ncbi:MAG TPA: helix-turn-helix transcriptional regulator [Actinomycetota bacterium]|nr:helix-turn-helix transcriptional regulator [Actinomycetota bacterium]
MGVRMTTMTMTFGERLRNARSTARMSQSDLTRMSGVPKTMLSRYENDHILPSITTLRKLALALGMNESSLIDETSGVCEALQARLTERGISIANTDEANRLGSVIADMVDAHEPSVLFLDEQARQA